MDLNPAKSGKHFSKVSSWNRTVENFTNHLNMQESSRIGYQEK